MNLLTSTTKPDAEDPTLRYCFRVVSPEKEYTLQVGAPGCLRLRRSERVGMWWLHLAGYEKEYTLQVGAPAGVPPRPGQCREAGCVVGGCCRRLWAGCLCGGRWCRWPFGVAGLP